MEYIAAKNIISNYSQNNIWFGVNYNMDIYKGCCHGCIYCDSRSDCYKISNFEKVRVKKDSINIIRRELRGEKRKGVVGTGAMSDPYNPYEKKLKLTRSALEEINTLNFGVSIATKSSLIIRDIDILKKIQEHSPVIVKITITTYDDELCKKIEPNVCSSSERFDAIKVLAESGIYTGVLFMPVLPFINDDAENIENIVKKAYESGAKFIYSTGIGVTLRNYQRQYYYEKLAEIFHDEKLVKKYIDTYGNDYECRSKWADSLWKVFVNECNKYGICYKMKDIIKGYKKYYEEEQLSWF
ncbi:MULTISPECIES: radical SAM protein [Clostridium]|uniref:Radical SAM protein n=1 Tax=Clostridium cibarium TaxID=2762247 RepID=A0ABR8PRB0_9CLOT|nr:MULTISPECIES: radical SAM protein [Clostridium]MBD7910715.1 radical SAM protein [Clostridium cibarium]